MRRGLKKSAMSMAALLLALPVFKGASVEAQQIEIRKIEAQQKERSSEADVRVLRVRDNIYMLTGAGGNITVQVGQDGLLLVDTGRQSMGEKVLAAIRTLSKEPLRQIILTHDHPDNFGGIATLRKAGDAIYGGNFGGVVDDFVNRLKTPGAATLTHEKANSRMAAMGLPEAALPTDSYFVERYDFYFNGEAVEVLHQPRAHTDGDSMVFFRRSDVLSTGDIFDTTSYPVIDEARGGSINGVIDGLNRILEITVPSYLQEGGTLVIPGRGRLCDEGDVNWYRYMVTVIRDRIQDMVRRGMTLEQVKAARPTLDYDARYGSKSGDWTTEMFVGAVYRGVGGSGAGTR